jgi:hypothetical protein
MFDELIINAMPSLVKFFKMLRLNSLPFMLIVVVLADSLILITGIAHTCCMLSKNIQLIPTCNLSNS